MRTVQIEVAHTLIRETNHRFKWLQREDLGVGFKHVYLCGMIATFLPMELDFAIRIKRPGQPGYWLYESRSITHDYRKFDEVTCPACLEHPKFPLMCLAETDLE